MRGLSLIKFLEISTIRIVATPLPQFDCLVSLCLGRTTWNGVSALFGAFLFQACPYRRNVFCLISVSMVEEGPWPV